MALSDQKLKFWAENEYNVIFSGKHGVGKTSIIEALFNEMYGEQGKDWLSFSAATMDPWVDFIGVPKEKTDENGNTFLTLVRPEALAKDSVKAIFFDEFNRSPKKVRNAVMELMQFKSINGHKFNNLKLIWAAINPPDEDDEGMVYDVEKIDPAQLDRFHIFIDLPYSVNKVFFKKKYGANDGVAACDWWNSLTPTLKNSISPRRLDYAMDIWSKGGDIKDIFPKNVPTTELMKQLNDGSYNDRIKDILRGNITKEKAKDELADEGLFKVVTEKILSGKSGFFESVVPLLEDEKMLLVLSKMSANNIRDGLALLGKCDGVYEVLCESIEATGNGLTAQKKSAIKGWMGRYYPGDIKNPALANVASEMDEFILNTKNSWDMNSSGFRLTMFKKAADILSNKDASKFFDTHLDKKGKAGFWKGLYTLCNRSNKARVTRFIEDNYSSLDTIKTNLLHIMSNPDTAKNVFSDIQKNKTLAFLLSELKVTSKDFSNFGYGFLDNILTED